MASQLSVAEQTQLQYKATGGAFDLGSSSQVEKQQRNLHVMWLSMAHAEQVRLPRGILCPSTLTPCCRKGPSRQAEIPTLGLGSKNFGYECAGSILVYFKGQII